MGQCSMDGPCSLREAVNQADADTGDTIVVPVGTYGLDSMLGAILLQSPMTITGAGALGTLHRRAGHIRGSSTRLAGAAVNVTGVTLENGETAASGGAALVESGSSLTLSDCTLTNNRAVNSGGAIEDQGAVTIQDCMLFGQRRGQRRRSHRRDKRDQPDVVGVRFGDRRRLGHDRRRGPGLIASTSPMTVDGDTIDADFGPRGGNVSVTTACPGSRTRSSPMDWALQLRRPGRQRRSQPRGRHRCGYRRPGT